MKRWCIAFVTVALLACGGGANDNGGESGGRSPLDPPPGQSPAPGEEEPVPNPHRLDFLRHRDSTMGMGLDSAFDPIGFGKGPFDPPYVPGDNELTLLVDVDGAMRVGPTLPLRGVGVVYLCCLSPDGDTAMAAAFTGSGYELIFVRGLRERNPEVHARIGWPMNPSWKRQPASIGFSADGTWAAVGTSENLSERVGIQLVTGLPEEPALGGYIDLASTPGLQGFPGVYSLDVSLDGRTIFAKKIFHDCTDPWKSRAEVQVVGRPLLATEARVHDPLVLPQESAIPPTPPWEGQPTGVAVGEAALLPDGDTAVVPSFGWSLSQPDARIFIVRGVRSGDPWIARTLGPDDGVDPFPNQVAVHPDGDQVLVANLTSMSVSRLSGLSGHDVGAIEVETMKVWRVAATAEFTPDGRHVLIANGQGPVNDSPPPLVTSHVFSDGALEPPHASVTGAIHLPPYWPDGVFETCAPSLSDYVDAFLPSVLAATLHEKVERAVRKADGGWDAEARAALDEFRTAVETLLGTGDLTVAQGGVLEGLAGLGQEQLSP